MMGVSSAARGSAASRAGEPRPRRFRPWALSSAEGPLCSAACCPGEVSPHCSSDSNQVPSRRRAGPWRSARHGDRQLGARAAAPVRAPRWSVPSVRPGACARRAGSVCVGRDGWGDRGHRASPGARPGHGSPGCPEVAQGPTRAQRFPGRRPSVLLPFAGPKSPTLALVPPSSGSAGWCHEPRPLTSRSRSWRCSGRWEGTRQDRWPADARLWRGIRALSSLWRLPGTGTWCEPPRRGAEQGTASLVCARTLEGHRASRHSAEVGTLCCAPCHHKRKSCGAAVAGVVPFWEKRVDLGLTLTEGIKLRRLMVFLNETVHKVTVLCV